MKTPNNFIKSFALTATACLLAARTFAQGTAFTYQGQLQNNGAPASGTYNLTFALFTNNTGGTAVAGPVTNNSVATSNGLFTVMLDFGSGPWNGESNWLEITVETNGAGSFTTLSPRQPLTPAPYAIFAAGANAAGLTGTITSNSLAPGSVGPAQLASDIGLWTQYGFNISYNTGFVGIGTTNPQEPLQIIGTPTNPIRHLEVSASSNAPYGSFFGLDASATAGGQEYLIFSTGGSAGEGQGKLVFKDQTSGAYGLTIQNNGYVGVGTTSPSATFQVNATNQSVAEFQSSAIEAVLSLANSSSGGNQWEMLSTGGGNGYQPGGLLIAASAGGGLINSPALVLAPNGNVGIDGTATPGSPLQVINAYCDGSTWHNASDRALKENFSPIDPLDMLDKVVALPINEWNYKKDKDAKHLGPVAQDFHAAFELDGSDDKSISTVDEGGVALAAIQGLNEKVEARSQKSEGQIHELEKENSELKQQLEEIKETLRNLTADKAK